MKKKGFFGLFLFFLAFLSTLNIGFGSWNVTVFAISGNSGISIGFSELPDVAYIGDKYYKDLGKALVDAASNNTAETIYVIPSLKIGNTDELPNATSIRLYANDYNGNTSSFEIKSGDTLSLPYSGTTCFSTYKNSEGADATSSVSALHSPATYCVSQVTIGSGVTLTNNGTINVGGIIGGQSGSYNPAGQTCDTYAEILCEGGDSPNLVNNGTIVNWGSIRGENIAEGSYGMINNSGSSLTTLFVVYENRGGDVFVEMGGGYLAALGDDLTFECSPFNRFYLPNTSVRMRTFHNAAIYGQATMYGNSAHNQCIVNLYGTSGSCLLQSYSGSYLDTYVPTEATPNNISIGLTGKVFTPLEIDFYGSYTINYMAMTLSVSIFSASISTKDCLFPITYYQRISFHAVDENTPATVISTQNLKILTGGSLYVGENVIFSVSKLAVYDTTTAITWTPGAENRYPSSGFEGGEFIVDGSANIDTFGGYAGTTKAGAQLNISTSAIIESNEYINNDAGTQTYTFSATGITSATGASASLSSGKHLSYEESGIYYWGMPPAISISYSFDSTTATNASEIVGDAQFSVDGVAYGNSATSFSVFDGSSFKLRNHYGISHFLVDGQRVESGASVVAASGMNIVAVVTEAYKISASLSSTTDGQNSSTLKITVYDDSSAASSFSKEVVSLDAGSSSGTKTGSAYVSSLSKFKVDCTYCGSNDPTVTGATKDSEGYYRRSGTGDVTVSATGTYHSCFLPGTLISMADGSTKPVEEIVSGDMVMAFNHEKGIYEATPVYLAIDHGESLNTVEELHFSNGSSISTVNGHGFMNLSSRKYETIDESNSDEYLGVSFVTYEAGNRGEAVLESYEVRQEVCRAYSLVTYGNLNVVADGLLTMTPYMIDAGLTNYIELDEGLKYEEESFENDLATYGHYPVEEACEELGIDENMYYGFNAKYLKISYGKGISSVERIKQAVSYFAHLKESGQMTDE